MSKIFKPRRGTKSTMMTTKANTVLSAGEMFVEFDGPVGISEASIKFGDGTTAYSSLPYALKNTDVSTSEVIITADNSSTSTAALNNVTSNKTTGSLIGSLKQAISLTNSELTNSIALATNEINSSIDEKIKVGNQYFYFDYQNERYGYNTNANRGADTFFPFRSDPDFTVTQVHTTWSHGNNNYRINYTFEIGQFYIVAFANDGLSSYVPTFISGFERRGTMNYFAALGPYDAPDYWTPSGSLAIGKATSNTVVMKVRDNYTVIAVGKFNFAD